MSLPDPPKTSPPSSSLDVLNNPLQSSNPSAPSGPATASAADPAQTHALADATPTPDLDTDDDVDSFEMEPVNPSGHRRRRSSLGPGHSGGSRQRSPRSRGHTPSTGGHKAIDEDSELVALEADGDDSEGLSDEDLHSDEEAGLTGRDRRRKRQKRDRNTRLDNRVVRDTITAEEKHEADRNVLRRLLINVTLIGLWYFFSLLISLVSRSARVMYWSDIR